MKIYQNVCVPENWIPKINGRALEIIAEIEILYNSTEFSIDVLCSQDYEEKTSIIYNCNTENFSIHNYYMQNKSCYPL